MYSVPNIECKPDNICHTLVNNLGVIYYNSCHSLSDFHQKFQSPKTILHYLLIRMQDMPIYFPIIGMNFSQSSIIHDNIRKLIIGSVIITSKHGKKIHKCII